MKILMLTPYLPYPPSSGGQIRSYNIIKQLSKLGHEVTLFCLVKDDKERQFAPELEKYCKEVRIFNRPPKPWMPENIFRTGFSSYPFLVIRNWAKGEKKAVEEKLKNEQFDLIHAETFYVMPHIPNTDIPIVLVDQTIEYKVYEHYAKNYRLPFLRPLLYIDVLKLKHWETYYWKKASKVVAVSEKDQQVMKQDVAGLKVEIVPNGVGEDLIEDVKPHYSQTILFMGNYAWLQNSEAARILAKKIFPEVQQKIKGVKLVIAGQNTEPVADLATEDIEIRNFAVDDIQSVKKAYRESGILVAPLYGPGGTRLKILSAMAARLPVVTTNVGIAGIGENNKTYLEGETPEELAQLTIRVLEDKKLYEKISENARSLVEKEYSYSAIAKKLNNLYQEVSNA